MSKYKRISNNFNNEIKEKKKQKNNLENNPSYLDTKLLMEKLGIKITNDKIYSKKNSMDIPKDNEKLSNINITTTLSNKDDNNNSKFLSSKSQKKRNNNVTNIKKNNITSASYEKRIFKKDQNKKIIELKNDKKQEKDNEKNIKENNENITKKKSIKKEINKQIIKKEKKINPNDNSSKKYRRLSQKQETKTMHLKKHKDSDDIKKATTIRMKNKSSTEKISNIKFSKKTSMDNNIKYYNEDLKINELEDISPKKIGTKKMTIKKTNEIKEKDDYENIEKQKTFRKNKAISVDKIISNNIFDFKSNNIKNNNKKIKENSIDSNKNTDNEESKNSENDKSNISEEEEEDYNIENQKEVKAVIRSNKRHLTEMASQKDEKRVTISDIQNKIRIKEEEEKTKSDLNKKQINVSASQDNIFLKEKEIIRSNKKHLTEINNQNKIYSNNNSLKEINKKESEKKIIAADNMRRRSMDNQVINERFESLMNNMVMKQNGGNSLFLRNYEKGQTYSKEIEIFIKNKYIKKKIKISSCTKAGCSGPGIVKTNQDSYFIKDNFIKKNNFFLGVCDGHGEKGDIISKYVSNKLPEYIKDLNYENIINNFKKINNEIYNNKNIESNMSGTTVVSLFITPEKIISSNLGDSRAALFKFDNGLYYSKYMTRDHKPSEPDENKRIVNNNGKIQKCYDEDLKKYIGPDRVWLKNKDEPGLAMSRSLGDKIAHSVGVSDEPEFKIFEYDGTEKFIVIASDGIWEYLHGDDCIKVIRPFYEENKDSEEAALALVKEAFRKWKRKELAIDDITAIIIFFDD